MDEELNDINLERFQKAELEQRARLNGADFVPKSKEEIRAAAARERESDNRVAYKAFESAKAREREESKFGEAIIIGFVAASVTGLVANSAVAAIIAFWIVFPLTLKMLKNFKKLPD